MDVLQGQAFQASWYPATTAVPLVEAACEVVAPDGRILDTPTPSLSTAFATIAGVVDAKTIDVDTTAGLFPGRKYVFEAPAWGAARVEIERIDGARVRLTAPPPADPAAGDHLVGLEVMCVVPASAIGTRGTHYRIAWTARDASDRWVSGRTECHVAATAFEDPVTPEEVVEVLEAHWATMRQRFGPRRIERIARNANRRLRTRLLGTGRYAHLIGDPNAFRPLASLLIRHELVASYGLVQPGSDEDAASYERHIRQMFDEEFAAVIRGLGWYDADDDGAVAAREVRFGAVELVR